MKFLQVIFSLFFLLVFPLLVVESSPSNDTLVSNITRGSSISLNDTSPYWLSALGNIAFGFYQLPCIPSSSNCTNLYVVGIWLVKSSQKTLVWTANRNDNPLYKPSSILFTDEGKLVLRILPENQDKPLIPGIQEPVSYAKMHDNGNLVLYGSESQIVWQSFDHPTDTILGGQKLKDGVELASSVSLFNRGSGKYKLSIRQSDGLVAIYYISTQVKLITDTVISGGFRSSVSTPVILNLDTTGELYLAGSDDVVLKYLYRNKNQQQEDGSTPDEGVHIYRATLDSGGHFNLYNERIEGNISDHEKSSSILVRRWYSYHMSTAVIVLITVACFLICVFLKCILAIFEHDT